MTRIQRRIAAAASVLILGFTNVIPAAGALYRCEGDKTLQADPVRRGEAVVLRLNEDTFFLPRVESASGAKYSDGKTLFWSKGGEAFAQVDGEIVARGCEEVSGAVEPELLREVLALPVVSSVAIDVAPFNARLQAARGAGEAWAESVVPMALHYVGDLEGRAAAIVKSDDPAESPSRSTVTIIRDGLLDDSVRAIWDEVNFCRTDEGGWALESANRAYRCRRGTQQLQHYGAELCP